VHKIEVDNKMQIKQVLYADGVLGIKGEEYRAFGGFQVWWYDKKLGICHCAESHWTDTRKQTKTYRFEKAVKILWHKAALSEHQTCIGR
jgi:hypothetical protein